MPENTQTGLPHSKPLEGHGRRLAAGPGNLRGKRILVIEDEPLVSMEIEACLSEAGAAIAGPAGTAARARQLIESETFDGAFVDANLGGETTDEIAVALTAKGIPYLFLTGYGRESLPDAFREAAVIEKPFTREQLVAAAGRLFQARSEVA
jgi:DNA-binding response OmpR family regulator